MGLPDDRTCYWGDLHNHCNASYGSGSVLRALDNARQHLDFTTVTGHAFWPDMPVELGNSDPVLAMHLGGFAKLKIFWPTLCRQLAEANRSGEFVTIPSYEWHSLKYGDHNAYFPEDAPDLLDGKDLETLTQILRDRGKPFWLLPHHIGYPEGWRGANWDAFDPSRSPLVEIFSGHGCSEGEDAPFPFYHSMGARDGRSLARHGLWLGKRFGFYAGTDSHHGYPGEYGHGVVGVWSDRLDRNSLWEAMEARRTVASTGARIRAFSGWGDGKMGDILPANHRGPLRLAAVAEDSIRSIDWIVGQPGGDVRVVRLPGQISSNQFSSGRHKIRLEVGLGNGMGVIDWNVRVTIQDGELINAQPCFRYNTFREGEETSSERLEVSGNALQLQARTAYSLSQGSYGFLGSGGGMQGVVVEVDARRETTLTVEYQGRSWTEKIADLVHRSKVLPQRQIWPSVILIHRAVPEREYRFDWEWDALEGVPEEGPAFLYARITQDNGQVAWTSPMFRE